MKKPATILILTLMAVSTLAAAQTRKIVRAEVPFEFIANGKTMPAAFYTITLSGNSLAVLSIRSGKNFVLAQPNTTTLSQPAVATVLVFHRHGAQYFLSGIRCEGEDRGYELPAGKAEMELQSKNATEGDLALIAGAK
jgi:hypothetical protein